METFYRFSARTTGISTVLYLRDETLDAVTEIAGQDIVDKNGTVANINRLNRLFKKETLTTRFGSIFNFSEDQLVRLFNYF